MKRIAVILFIALLTLAPKCGKGEWNDEVRNNLNRIGIANTDSQPRSFRQTTRQGAIIDSVVTVPQHGLDALDRGLQRRIDRFAIMFPGWPAARSVAGTRVLFIHPNRTYGPDGTPSARCSLESIPGAPCLFVGGIKTAGTVLGTHDLWDAIDLDPPLVLPHQAEGNWQWLEYLAAAAHNEDEHRAGWLNLRNNPTGVFYQFLGANDVHPWQWGTPVPYLHNDEIDRLIPKIPHACVPVPTEKELKKIADELGIPVDQIKK